jgi:hypothetical protein
LKKRVPAGRCQTRKKHENEALQHQRQGGRGKVGNGIKMAELVVGAAVGVSLVPSKQPDQEAVTCIAFKGLTLLCCRWHLPVFGNMRQIRFMTRSFCVRVNQAMQEAQGLRQQQDKREQDSRRQPAARPFAVLAGPQQTTSRPPRR